METSADEVRNQSMMEDSRKSYGFEGEWHRLPRILCFPGSETENVGATDGIACLIHIHFSAKESCAILPSLATYCDETLKKSLKTSKRACMYVLI